MGTQAPDKVSPARLGFWQLTARDYTLVFPAEFEPDPQLVKQIRVNEPEFVPVWAIETYRTPAGSDVPFGFHVIGKWAAVPDEPEDVEDPPEIVHAARPSSFPFSGGVIYAVRPWTIAAASVRSVNPSYPVGGPDLYLPFDARLVKYMDQTNREYARTFGSMRSKVMEQIHAQQEAEERAVQKIEEDARLSLLDDKRQIVRAFEEGRFEAAPMPGPKVSVETPRRVFTVEES